VTFTGFSAGMTALLPASGKYVDIARDNWGATGALQDRQKF